jgi:PadR family transcriptional regulator PadR
VSSGRRQGRAPIAMPGNYLHGCLLLLIAESPAHGYDLVERLAAFGLTTVDSAAVYRALRALDEDGLLESWWEESEAGPVRRRYRISEQGVGTLEGWAAAVGDSAYRLNTFVARHAQLMTGNG